MRIGIIGLGLIGGSLGLDLRQQGYEVVGVSRQQSTCDIALKNNVVSEVSIELDILGTTEIVFVCTPIASILPTIVKLKSFLSSDTIITDVGSVKKTIVNPATELWANFVGSHPMAGTANQGIDAAQSQLFNHVPCVITPVKNTNRQAMEKVAQIWETVNCHLYYTAPEIHDRAVAWISHLPVFISANLIHSCIHHDNNDVINLAKQLASSGFRDTSRVGGGNVELGLMMAQYNKQQLLTSLKEYQDNLNKMINAIEDEKWDSLSNILMETQKQRPSFLTK